MGKYEYMGKYTIVICDEDGFEIDYMPQKTRATAAKNAVKTANAERQHGRKVYVSFFRKSDGQHGYYNPNGNHEITGVAW